MTLSDLASIATVISSITVLGSIIYLALQVRQNTLAHHLAAHQHQQNFLDKFLTLLADPDVASAYLRASKGDPDLTEREFVQFTALMRILFVGVSEQYWHESHGVLDGASFTNLFEGIRARLDDPGTRAVWDVSQKLLIPEFCERVNAMLAEAPPGASRPLFELWKESLSKHRVENTARGGT